MYMMLPEFRINTKYNIKRAWDDFYLDPKNKDIVAEIDKNIRLTFEYFLKEVPEGAEITIDEYIERVFAIPGMKKYRFSEIARERFKEWFKNRKQNYILGKGSLSKVTYDYNKLPQEQSRSARNNAFIDMIWGVLSNEDTVAKMLNPGGFDYQKRAARIATILSTPHLDDLFIAPEVLKELGTGLSYKDLYNLDLDKLDVIIEYINRNALNPLSPMTQVTIHSQNMTGGKMIGVYANHNANHALMQHTDLALSEEGSFSLFGRTLTSLHSIMNDNGEFISRNNANFLAASVDNVKDNTLFATNQNMFTGNVAMLLSRLGYNPVEIAIFLRQPIVMDITQAVIREGGKGKSEESIINKVVNRWKQKAGINSTVSYKTLSNKEAGFDLESMMDYIQYYASYYETYDSPEDLARDKKMDGHQVRVGLLFQQVFKSANALKQLVQATRSDTDKGAVGPTIADTMITLNKTSDFINDYMMSEHHPLFGADVINPYLTYNEADGIDALREQLLNSPLPFLQAFYSLGVKQAETLMGKFFPHFTKSFTEVLDGRVSATSDEKVFEGLRDMTKTGRLNAKTLNSIFNDLLMYVMSKTAFFGNETTRGGNFITSEERRRKFINTFPNVFKAIVQENPDIAALEFIQRLVVSKTNNKAPIPVLVFKNVGRLTTPVRDRYMRDWASLLYMPNPKAQQLALNLFRYSYYRNGFAFGPSTFIHLAPTAIRLAVPEYVATLNSMLSKEDDFEQFIEQYVYNHLDNRALVPEVSNESSFDFIGDDGKVLDEVTLTIGDNSSVEDKQVVKKEYRVENETMYEFMKFIGTRIKGKFVYYKLTGETADGKSGIYTRIEPLGFKSNFLEYEYGKNAEDMHTVIDQNKKVEETIGTNDSMTGNNNLEDFDSDNSQTINDDIANAAFLEVFGSNLDSSKVDEKDITNIKPNTDYEDADNNKLCGGAPIIASF